MNEPFTGFIKDRMIKVYNHYKLLETDMERKAYLMQEFGINWRAVLEMIDPREPVMMKTVNFFIDETKFIICPHCNKKIYFEAGT